MNTRLDGKGRTILALDPTLDGTQATTLAGLLVGLRGKNIIVDATEVQHLGALCGQVLVSAKRTWNSDGHAIRVGKASAQFVEHMRLLGLTSLLPVEQRIQ